MATRRGDIELAGLTKSYDGMHNVVQGINLKIPDGAYCCFLGPSGCGKTTLLRSIAGLEIPDSGSISIADKVQTSIGRGILVPPYARAIGFVFQNYALWPNMTVFNNVAFGLKLRK